MIGIDPEFEIKTLYESLPKKPYFSDENYYQLVRSKEKAEEYTHVQYNHPDLQKYIVIDLDGDALSILDTNLQPNLLVLNKDNTKAHAYYRLRTHVPCTVKSNIRPQKTLSLLINSLNNFLNGIAGADNAFTGHIAKNPLHKDGYRVLSFRDEPWDFSDLFQNIPDEHIKFTNTYNVENEGKKANVCVGERNYYLFNSVRLEAYKMKNNHSTFASFNQEVTLLAEKINNSLPTPLKPNEVKATTKSITKWKKIQRKKDKKKER